jgi:hypothetical protein
MVSTSTRHVPVSSRKNMNYLVYYSKPPTRPSGIEKGGNGVESVTDEEASL